jgi:hypothetical protein
MLLKEWLFDGWRPASGAGFFDCCFARVHSEHESLVVV